MLTTNQKELVAETAIIHECAKRGIDVARPLDSARYDLILDLGPKLLRVQCKWAVRQGDVVSFGRAAAVAGEKDTSTARTARLRSMQSLPTALAQAAVTFCHTSSRSAARWSICAWRRRRTTRSQASDGRAITNSELH
jgi:hypothetical protein